MSLSARHRAFAEALGRALAQVVWAELCPKCEEPPGKATTDEDKLLESMFGRARQAATPNLGE